MKNFLQSVNYLNNSNNDDYANEFFISCKSVLPILAFISRSAGYINWLVFHALLNPHNNEENDADTTYSL